MSEAELIEQFKSFTNCGDNEQAKFYLESHGWDVEGAVSSFFDAEGEEAGTPAGPGSGPGLVAQSEGIERSRATNLVPQGDFKTPAHAPAEGPRVPYSGMSRNVVPSGSAPPPGPEPKKKASKAPSNSKFRTLSDFRKEEEDSGDEDGPQDYYAGGEKSGQVIQDPNDPRSNKKQSHDLTQRIFQQARQHGARPASEVESEQKKPTFEGSGYRLGSGQEPAPTVVAADPPQPKKKSVRTLTFWRGGFTVDDGPLRRFDDPANRAFLQDIERGLAPRELEEEAGGEPVSINLVDRKFEDYTPPPEPKVKVFAGQGYALGSTAGPSTSSSTSATAAPARSPASAPIPATGAQMVETGPKKGLVCDPTLPTTSLQIRLRDGTRLVANFNHTHTVQDIRNFVDAALPTPAGGSYDLMTTFPNRMLTDISVSIADAKLQGAVIVQKLR